MEVLRRKKSRYIRKFDKLFSKNKVTQSVSNLADKKLVINMSSRQLTHLATDVLAEGIKLPFASKIRPNKEIIDAVEGAAKALVREEADIICAKISNQ